MYKVKQKFNFLLINIPIMILSLTCIYPVIWLLYSSVKTNQEFALSTVALPKSINMGNYIKAFVTAKFHIFIINSVFTSFCTLIIVLLASYTMGYLLSRYRFRGRNLVYIALLAGVMIPIHALMVPLFIQYKNFGFLDNRFSLVLPYVSIELPTAVFLLESYIKGISTEMEDAASIDGANMLQTMYGIIMPICKPILSTVVILTFMFAWNEFPFAQILVSDQKYKTIPVGLTYFTTQYTTDYTLLIAALCMATIPVLVIYLLFYNKVMEGMMAGAIKG
ncbi:carbohydrate ABC transporter permease [Lachnospiraceae bacterium OM04-12BH]|nr:carbohydrate ABC transporter permease [Lachnospiraceae bacterium OM04-12BH]